MTFYEEEMPQEVREEIQRIADTSEMTISATQDAPVFIVPPRVQEPPQKEELADLYPELAAQVLRFVESLTVPAWAMVKMTPRRWRISPSSFTTPFSGRKSADCFNPFWTMRTRKKKSRWTSPSVWSRSRSCPRPLPGTGADRRNRRLSGGGRICGIQRTGRRRFDGLPCHGGKGNSQDVADFIEREFLSEEPEPASLEIAKEFINDFCEAEYGSPADFSDLEKVGIATPTVTDEEIPIQVNADLVHYRIERYLDGKFLERRQYESLDELIQNELAELDFDQLTSVDQDYFNEKYPPDIEPYIFCEWSESPVFEDGNATVSVNSTP